MKIYHEENVEISKYIENNKNVKLEEQKNIFDITLKRIKNFKYIDENTKFLEIGIGTGWFPILCEMEGLSCRGLEISPQLVNYALQLGNKYGVKPDIDLGNIEEVDIGSSGYDVILAETVFEHVEHWQQGIKKAFNALKPGGLLMFVSTNKFSLKSTEYNFPLYGWLPDKWRYKLRRYRQGEDIMKLGIDFNQFTYFSLRRFFKDIGFSHILDWIEFVDPEVLARHTFLKKSSIKIIKKAKPLKPFILFFLPVTSFICIK